MSSAIDNLTGPERAAIMIMYLEKPVAKKLLHQMDDDEIQAIGMAISKIETLPPDTIEEVVRVFVRDLSDTMMVPRTGPDFVNQVLPGLIDPRRQDNIIPMLRRRVDKSFEKFISQRPPGTVSALLRDERPQTQAVLLSLMGQANAARVLKNFNVDEQREIVMRMARLKRIPGELADEVMAAHRAALGSRDDQLSVGGVDATARSLGQMKRQENEDLLMEIEDTDYDMADQLRRRMVVFTDLSILNGRAIQMLLKQVERDDLLVALKSATPEMKELFLGNVSKRAAEDMREEIEIMEKVSRKRIKEAEESIVAAALKLAEDGSINLNTGSDEDDE